MPRTVSPELRVTPLAASDTNTTDVTRLTDPGVANWPVRPIGPERVVVESTDGLDIETYLIDPRESDAVADDATEFPTVVSTFTVAQCAKCATVDIPPSRTGFPTPIISTPQGRGTSACSLIAVGASVMAANSAVCSLRATVKPR